MSSTTLNRYQAEMCIVDEMLGWEFPKPVRPGWIVVEYPIVMTPADTP